MLHERVLPLSNIDYLFLLMSRLSRIHDQSRRPASGYFRDVGTARASGDVTADLAVGHTEHLSKSPVRISNTVLLQMKVRTNISSMDYLIEGNLEYCYQYVLL